MKIILDTKIELTPLANTVRELRNEGYDVISVVMIAEKHMANGYKIDERTVLKRMCGLHKELRVAYPKVSTQLMSRLYIINFPNMKRFNCFRLPPKSDREIEAVNYAKLCLAIGCKAYAIRFVIDKNDFLCRVWEDHFLSRVATGLLVSRVRSTAQAAENRHIPAREAAINIVGAAIAIAPAIDGSPQLPADVKEIKKLAAETFTGKWEKNFNKSRKGAWTL
jgi:hypothetical protein